MIRALIAAGGLAFAIVGGVAMANLLSSPTLLSTQCYAGLRTDYSIGCDTVMLPMKLD